MKIRYYEKWSIQDAESNPTTLFIFGDNLKQVGTGGQACIRYSKAKNAHGIPTKKTPSLDDKAFFTDDEYHTNMKHIIDAFNRIDLSKYHAIALPKNGLGTGLAQMPERCPKTFRFLNQCLEAFVKKNKN